MIQHQLVPGESAALGIPVNRSFAYTGRHDDPVTNFVDYDMTTGLRIGDRLSGTAAPDYIPLGGSLGGTPATPPQGFLSTVRVPLAPAAIVDLSALPAGTNRVEMRVIGQDVTGEWNVEGVAPTTAPDDDLHFETASWITIQGADLISKFRARADTGPGQIIIQAYEISNAEENPSMNHGIGQAPAQAENSDRHDFTGVTNIDAAALLAQGGRGDTTVTWAQISVKTQSSTATIDVTDGGGTTKLDQSGYTTVDADGAWSVACLATDVVRISWRSKP